MEDEKKSELVEGEDFYREGPYIVFTEKFLKKRGYCCESGCRHCPYKGRSQKAEGRSESD
ncbi:MAG TPA: DUF5522 domain-containing protein [Thermoanaerobaculia bacterium]|nr:DUF5522 domain-containing protein [Thermoanaerobaculia bacterium]